MRHLNATAKHNARLALRENWGKAIAMVLLLLAVTVLFNLVESLLAIFFHLPGFVDILSTPGYYLDNIPNGTLPSLAVTGICALCAFLVLAPLSLGVTNWYYRLIYGHTEDFASIFTFFESLSQLRKALWLKFQLGLRSTLWGIFFLAPGSVLCFMGSHLISADATRLDHVMAAIGITIGVFSGIVGLALTWIVCNRYFLAPYLICDDRSMKVSKAIRLSVQATRGRKTQLALFQFSFFWWYLASLLMIPFLYLSPYLNASLAIYARYFIEREGLGQACETEEPSASQSTAE